MTEIECVGCGERRTLMAKGMCAKCCMKKYSDEHSAVIAEYHKKYYISKHGMKMKTNVNCAQYLGIHVAERVLSKVFKDVQTMPMHHSGYDFVCNKGKKIDVKSSTTHMSTHDTAYWTFTVNKNKVAEFFLCIAFDDRENLTPLHVWLLPGDLVNHLKNATIAASTVHKCFMYDMYSLGDKLIATVDENEKLRCKLQRADKKIKELCATREHLGDMFMRQYVQITTMHRLCHEAQLGTVVANKNTTRAEHTIEELDYKLQQADKNIIQKIGVIDSLHGYKNLYDDGQKIRRGLAATIIEKDKSIGDLVDRVNDECEKNEKNVESLNNLSVVAHRYAGELLTNEFRIDGLEKEIAELRDKYEPKLVRCDKYETCKQYGCEHWVPHNTNYVCGHYALCEQTCVEWIGNTCQK